MNKVQNDFWVELSNLVTDKLNKIITYSTNYYSDFEVWTCCEFI